MDHNEQAVQRVIGTATTAATLTTSFADTVGSSMLANRYRKMALDVTYTPGANNSRAQIIVEYSQDPLNADGPITWRQFVTSVAATTQVDVYGQGGDTMTTTSGTPINVPNANNSTSGQAVTVHIVPDTDLTANWVRIRAKEVTAGAAGTLGVIMTLQS